MTQTTTINPGTKFNDDGSYNTRGNFGEEVTVEGKGYGVGWAPAGSNVLHADAVRNGWDVEALTFKGSGDMGRVWAAPEGYAFLFGLAVVLSAEPMERTPRTELAVGEVVEVKGVLYHVEVVRGHADLVRED